MSIRESYILEIFDVVSIYTKITVDKGIDLIKELTDKETTNLVNVRLISTYFILCGDIYEKTHSVSMGSPLSPVVANLFMGHFEEKSIDSFSYKPE